MENNIYKKVIKVYSENNIGLVNMTDEFFALYLRLLVDKINKNILVVTPTIHEANRIYDNVGLNNNLYLFQSETLNNINILSKSPEIKAERLNVLNNLIKCNKNIVITDMIGYISKLTDINTYKKSIFKLKPGDKVDLKNLESKLIDLGYCKELITTKTGEYSPRGFVLDIFPINYQHPVRIEFFGNEIESIRLFEGETQKSIKNIDYVEIYPFNEKGMGLDSSIYDYMEEPLVIFKDYTQIKATFKKFVDENFEMENFNNSFYDFDDIKPKCINYYFQFDDALEFDIKKYNFDIKTPERLNEDVNKINTYIRKNIDEGKTIIIALSNINKTFLNSFELPYIITDENKIYDNKVNIIKTNFTKGFILNNYVFLTEHELFNKNKKIKKYNPVYKYSTRINDISKINKGDYVVHNINGIGIYNGLKTLNKQGIKNDYLEILYAKGDKLYIPATKLYLINKYSGKDGMTPKINSLNSTAWSKSKQRVREKIKYEAERLLKVQAERKLKKGFAFSKDTPMQQVFEAEFEYDETEDQIKVTNEIKKDMESIIPMDRILCGDVGYGKTEVAFRALFKCVMDSKQAMYLCPTTLLSKQQYESAKNRFKNFPVNIELLNRFISTKKANMIIEDFKNGKIDILFGTHKILNNKIKAKDLGLLVIDEEQRFGVAHKEKIKEYKSDIDVLTLTATPIPRTLQMAMLGIKNLSLIETPPKNRKGIQTYVAPEDDRLIRDVIYKEMSRGGQTYILYNRVENIEVMLSKIKRLVPDASITYAHGQMDKKELEGRMQEFIDGKYDVLLCTTIIETGVDIANVNSLIIFDADQFGLSQLYQIRGRIGRSERIGYAYLLYSKNKVLSETAIKRLSVIKQFTELGSGFSIAARDLSIRGAGDILGSEQAGFIDTVGIDMYMRMLEEEVNRLKGIEPLEEEEEKPQVLNVESYIDDSYVSSEELKIEIHKMINKVKTEDDYVVIKSEIEDRFGKVDKSLINYMKEKVFENLIKNKGISQVIDNNKYVELVLTVDKTNSLNYEDLFIKSLKISNKFKFSYVNKKIHIKIDKLNNYLQNLIDIVKEL